jgi:membrane protease YdiL (CAAX protease family)
MTEDPHPFEPVLEPPPQPVPPREPFWEYGDLFLVLGLGVPGMMIVATVVTFLLNRVTSIKVASLLPAQFLGYGVLFGVIWFIFQAHYGRPFWDSLAWRKFQPPTGRILLYGVITAMGIVLIATALGTKDAPNPMKDLLTSRGSIVVVTIVGTTIGPVVEELIFRGFLQPLLVRSLGAIFGILISSVPFGLLHLPQYGWSWRHAVLVTLAGCAFGWMRHITGSTRASSLMHAAYNGVFFVALLSQWRNTPNTW